ncbi:MAG: ABC transporter ATP-binding protein [Acutalibacter sp.]|nr:ABC transporter ATP-binding protein [Acutalibacter sp.]
MDAILTYDLSKEFRETQALHRLNLQVPEGQILACVGKRNAGKTTLIRLLSGLCRPSAGEAFVLGLSPFFEGDRLHAVTGTVLDTAHLYQKMTLTENLRFFAGINGIDENDTLDRMSFLLHRLDIWEGRDEPINSLPTDVRRRASLVRALIHSPKVLLLDEPTKGLDAEAAASIRSLLTYLAEQEGVTVLI